MLAGNTAAQFDAGAQGRFARRDDTFQFAGMAVCRMQYWDATAVAGVKDVGNDEIKLPADCRQPASSRAACCAAQRRLGS